MLKNCSLESLLERDSITRRTASHARESPAMREAIKQTQERITVAFDGAGKVRAKVKAY